jgi:hypothetical protein
LRHGYVYQAGTAGNRCVEQGHDKLEGLALRHRQPVIGLGVRGDGDVDAAIGAAQKRAGIQREGPPGIFSQNISLLVGGVNRPETGGRQGAGQPVPALAAEAVSIAVDGGGEGQSLGGSVKQLARIGAVRFGVRVGLDRLRFGKRIPRADADRSKAGCRLKCCECCGNTAAKGDQKGDADKEWNSEHAVFPF